MVNPVQRKKADLTIWALKAYMKILMIYLMKQSSCSSDSLSIDEGSENEDVTDEGEEGEDSVNELAESCQQLESCDSHTGFLSIYMKARNNSA